MSKKLNFRLINCVLMLAPVLVLLVSTIDMQNHFFPYAQGQPTVGTSGSENETDTISPEGVEPVLIISNPSNNTQVPVGEVLVSGNASNAGDANIQTIGLKVDEGDYIPVTPQVPGNWSNWSVTIDISESGPHTLKARADYGVGDQTWSIGNVLVNAVSNADVASNTTFRQSVSEGNVSAQSSNEMPNESAAVSPKLEIPAPPSSSQEEVQAAPAYKNPIDILFGR
jgi:hypothetical protein